MKAKPHGVCFRCRVTFKDVMLCPRCRQPLINMGTYFAAPPRSKAREWKKIYERIKPRLISHPGYYNIPRHDASKPEYEYWEWDE